MNLIIAAVVVLAVVFLFKGPRQWILKAIGLGDTDIDAKVSKFEDDIETKIDKGLNDAEHSKLVMRLESLVDKLKNSVK